MVGVKNSQGCITCIRRKVKCSGERPSCHRCKKAGFACLGYREGLKWVAPNTTTNSQEFSQARSSSSSCENEVERPSRRILVARMPGLDGLPIMSQTLSSYNDSVYCAFFLSRWFVFGAQNKGLECNKDWIWEAVKHPSASPVAHSACRSLIIAFFANVTHNDVLRQEAFRVHAHALTSLQIAMQHEISFDILSAVLLLGLYETCAYTMQAGWQRHFKALKYLYEFKGPRYFRTKPASSLLMMTRHGIINHFISVREKCFLADPAWKGLLETSDNVASLTIKLGDIVVEIPAILEGILQLEKAASDDNMAWKLLQKLLQHLEELRKWWMEWALDPYRLPSRLLVAETEGQFLPTPPPTSDLEPSTFLHFQDLECASGFSRYHAHIILAMHWTNRLLAASKSLPARYTPFLRPQILDHAKAICQALPFYTLPQNKHVGAIYNALPARIAWQAFPENSAHARWIENLLIETSKHNGFTFPQYLLRHIETRN